MMAVAALAGCVKKEDEKKKLEVSPASITLKSAETQQITTKAKKPTFESKDTYYASVNADGLVTASCIGQTEIVVSSSIGTATIPVTVSPQYNLYPELDGIVGKGMEAMTAVMGSDYKVVEGNELTGTAGQSLYTYKGPSEYVYTIAFTFKDGKCDKIAVAIPKEHYDMAKGHLMESYSMTGKKGEEFSFMNHDKNVEICLTDYSETYWAIGYLPK